MFPEFFLNKAKEVLSFLHIMKGKATGNPEARKQGVDEALKAMDKERAIYLKEKNEAESNIDASIPGKDRDVDQDISAI